jgi:hypothetical protein
MNLLHISLGPKIVPLFLDIVNVKVLSNVIKIEEAVTEGITVTKYVKVKERTPRYPRYRSWAGFEQWVKHVELAFGMSYAKAWVCMLDPEKPIDWVLSLPEEVAQEIMDLVTPFNRRRVERGAIDYWMNNGGENLCTFKDVCFNGRVLEKCRPRNNPEFRRARYMVCSSVEINDKNLEMFHAIRGMKRSPEELVIFSMLGMVTPKMEALFNKILHYEYGKDYNPSILLKNCWYTYTKLISQIYKSADPAFYDGKTTVQSLVKAGVPVKQLVPAVFTRKEAARFVEENGLVSYQFLGDRAREWYIKTYLQIPQAWEREIRTVEVAKWANNHVAQLSKSRLVHGPGGTTATFHYHQILREVNPDMLVQGIKTSWKKVMKDLQTLAEEKIRARMGECVKLPTLRHKAVTGCVRITNTVELIQEGEVMHHCVGGYVDACLSKTSFIYHIGDNRPKGGTLEVIKDVNGLYVASQLYGVDDTPVPELMPVVEKLLKAINAAGSTQTY